ncbi:Leucine-rich repeat, ribonuclease inhibitor subtype [Phytophthora cinnamomi]|uniref:Leucine-rich repeat, ribonuclease inhibitor subtype n=1 Tax=Phytophthora cinnamomi TaxID=4785 RepID=UPI00355A4D78|nr:Leucine-rich repeat, ribonuclease inhibitor subtype [Phytophthora cinnamomi]
MTTTLLKLGSTASAVSVRLVQLLIPELAGSPPSRMPHHAPPPATSPSSSSSRVLARSIPRGRSWHNNVDDRLTRKLMMLRLRRLHPVLAGTKCTAAASNGSTVVVPSLVQRLEWMLYNAAHSMHEYTHEQSLERRVQALVTQLEPKVAIEHRQQQAANTTRNSSSKRYRDIGGTSSDELDKKRQRLEEQAQVSSHNSRPFRDRSVFMLENDNNLVALVLSFLSGRTVLQLRSVNRFLSDNAPRMQAHQPRGNQQVAGLRRLCRGRRIRQTNRADHGELLLRDITRAFERGACPELQELDLGSPLDYFAESDDVLKCLEAFATGRRRGSTAPRGAVAAGPLKYLRLDSTYLGDARLNRLADVFEQTADRSCTNCFGLLKTLVLRNNFIGEAGCQALLRMLQCLPALRVLDMSGNILTDLDALALADWISSRTDDLKSSSPLLEQSECYNDHEDVQPRWRRSVPPQAVRLRTLLLQDNFIGQEGLEALSSALNARLIPS